VVDVVTDHIVGRSGDEPVHADNSDLSAVPDRCDCIRAAEGLLQPPFVAAKYRQQEIVDLGGPAAAQINVGGWR